MVLSAVASTKSQGLKLELRTSPAAPLTRQAIRRGWPDHCCWYVLDPWPQYGCLIGNLRYKRQLLNAIQQPLYFSNTRHIFRIVHHKLR